MDVKRGPAYYAPKKAGGINLTLEVWERVRLTAEVEKSSLSRVMEAVLDEHLLPVDDLIKLLPPKDKVEGGLGFAPDQEETTTDEPNADQGESERGS